MQGPRPSLLVMGRLSKQDFPRHSRAAIPPQAGHSGRCFVRSPHGSEAMCSPSDKHMICIEKPECLLLAGGRVAHQDHHLQIEPQDPCKSAIDKRLVSTRTNSPLVAPRDALDAKSDVVGALGQSDRPCFRPGLDRLKTGLYRLLFYQSLAATNRLCLHLLSGGCASLVPARLHFSLRSCRRTEHGPGHQARTVAAFLSTRDGIRSYYA